jgi:tetratricopeptide (TPR) repeat protein
MLIVPFAYHLQFGLAEESRATEHKIIFINFTQFRFGLPNYRISAPIKFRLSRNHQPTLIMRILSITILISLICCTSKPKAKPIMVNAKPDPNLIRALLDSGFQEDCDTAIVIYTSVINLDSNNAEAFWRRGNEFYRTKRYREALSDLNKSLEVDSNFSYSQVISDRGQTKEVLSLYQDAITDFTRAINLSLTKDTSIPQGLEGYYYNRGRVKLKIGDTTAALIDLDSAIHFWSSHHFAIKRRAMVNCALGNYEEAMNDYKLLMKQGGDFPDDEEWAADFYYRAIAKKHTGNKSYKKDLKKAEKYKYYPGKIIYIKGIIDRG